MLGVGGGALVSRVDALFDPCLQGGVFLGLLDGLGGDAQLFQGPDSAGGDLVCVERTSVYGTEGHEG